MYLPEYLAPVVVWLGAWGVLGHFDVIFLKGALGVWAAKVLGR